MNTVHTVAVCYCCKMCHRAACKAACNLEHVPIGALKALALYEDSRPRVVKVTKEWNWRPLVSVLEHEDVNPPASCPCSLSFCLSCCLSCLKVLVMFPFFLPSCPCSLSVCLSCCLTCVEVCCQLQCHKPACVANDFHGLLWDNSKIMIIRFMLSSM